MYAKFLKRFFDLFFSLFALICLLPLFVVLIIMGSIEMKGNPFFVQQRIGKNERIFKLIKFRTMTNEKDKDGNLLPDDVRLNKYGRLLRSTSLDELPELINILTGDMSIIGPRPLVVKYLDYYSEREHHRHDVRPGLTGLAQASGRNSLSWEQKFEYDLEYINTISFSGDIKIVLKTIECVFSKSDIGERGQGTLQDFDEYRQQQIGKEENL